MLILVKMSEAVDRIKIRELGIEDYEEVMEIRKPEDVYGGRDYLPTYYKLFMETEGYKGYGVDVDGKLVSAEFGVCLDDGKTMVTRAARVGKEWEGKRVYKQLEQHTFDEFIKKYGIKRKAVTFDQTNLKMTNLVREGKYKLIFERSIHTYNAVIQDVINRTHNLTSEVRSTTASEDYLKCILSSTKTISSLFPGNRITVFWVPHRILESNIPHIMLGDCMCVTSGLENMAEADLEINRALLTFGKFYDTTMCLMYHVDVYGFQIQDLKSHLIRHFSRLNHANVNTDIQLMLYTDNETNAKEIDIILAMFGFERIESPFVTQICAEKNIA